MKTQLNQPQGDIPYGKPCPYEDACSIFKAGNCPYIVGEIDPELIAWKHDFYWNHGFLCDKAKELDHEWRMNWVRRQQVSKFD